MRFKSVTTQHLVLRGWFQTLPIAVYGQRLGPDPAQQARQQPNFPTHGFGPLLRVSLCVSSCASAKHPRELGSRHDQW